jgi:4-amino-4-deoxy-L-arabinose transferase-like glycosyltransferase
MTKNGTGGAYKKSCSKMLRVEKSILLINVCIIIVAAALFIPFLGGVHLFDWDEINFAESAREMIESGDYLTVQINFVPFWEKPPLFIWMQVASMKLFGINEFAARFPNALCGIITLIVIFNIGLKVYDKQFGLLWVMLYAGSLLPFLYFKSGIIDPWFNLFIFLGIYQFYLYFSGADGKMLHSAASAFFIGLAVLTKGPVALLVFSVTLGIFLIIRKFRIKIHMKDLVLFFLVFICTGGIWFILQILKGNFEIIADFITYQIRLFRTKDAGHGGFFLYHFLVLLIGVFPASILALPSLADSKSDTGIKKDFYTLMLVLFWVVLILFTIVKTKIAHYSSLCYFPLTFMATWSVYYRKIQKPLWDIFTRSAIMVTGILLAVVIAGLTLIDHYKTFIVHHSWIKDPFTIACLMANGGWKGFEFVTGLVLLAGVFVYGHMVKNNALKAVYFLTGTVFIYMFLTVLLITPRAEAYSQHAAVEFFESVSNEDAYLLTVGYKSYAHLFYGKAKKHIRPESKDEKWILTGNIDKNAYFSMKIHRKENFMKDYPGVQFLYEKNGFAFFKRSPSPSNDL